MQLWPHFRTALAASALIVALVAAGLGAAFALLHDMERSVGVVSDEGEAAFAFVAIASSARDVERFALEESVAMPPQLRRTDVYAVDAALGQMRDALAFTARARSSDDTELAAMVVDLRTAFLAYLESRDDVDLLALNALARATRESADSLAPSVTVETAQSFADLLGALQASRLLLLILAVAAAPIVVGAIMWLSHRLGRAIIDGRERQASLVAINRRMERRNQQFFGIYRIVTEVTETLSVKYVVDTTTREVRALVDADLVVLRILEGDVLHVYGVETASGIEAPSVGDVVLGSGLEGRAAKRGRYVHIGSGDTRDVSLIETPLKGTRSVIVVPLIVGARVVGTVSCWSRTDGAFNDDDQQALEMMASQVATAIAAASLHEGSENDAYHDALTGLPNRRRLAEDMRFEFNAAVQRGRQTAVAMVDIDHFKRFNDEHGHAGGDRALQKVAQALAAGLRADDRMYRYGGEEFLIVFDKLNSSDAFEACERLRATVAAEDILDDAPARVTASIGLATAPDMASDFERLIAIADDALYRSKEAGRNRTTIYQKSAIEIEAA